MKTILVHMAYDDGRRRRLRAALALAADHRAHLIGLFTRPPYVTPPAIVGRGASSAFLREMKAGLHDQEQQARAEFDEAVSETAISAEWLRHEGAVNEGLAYHSHVADLLVVSQTPPETVEDVVTGSRPDQVMLETGCPVLVVPHGNGETRVCRRVLIAWTRTRESSLAVRNALPILRRANSVTILTSRATRARPGEAIRAYLERHDIRAEVRVDFGDNDEVGEIILGHAADMAADLVVMGAYGHSRLREVILGGTTKHVLTHTTIPVLMSH
jgi:nucleotide-binding universal stress UspA family protein